VKRRIAFILATWFGCGRVPLAPGTAGTLGAIPLFLLLRPGGPLLVLLVAAALAVIGIWAAGEVVVSTGQGDPQIVVIDEVVGVLVTLAASGPSWTNVVAGFVLFRIFDQWKPWPARKLESLHGGFGVVMDDVAAGIWGAAALGAMRHAGLP
jgi:phosphatidylglycerophosphatase A